jgi:hypothetical protein
MRRSPRIAAFLAKKKPNDKFIKHRPTVFDEFPYEIIRDNLFPFLDYDSRINLNQCIPIWDRISKKMDRMSVKKHDRNIRIITIRGHFDNIENSSDNGKVKYTTKLLKTLQLPLFFSLIQEATSFRNATVRKLDDIILLYSSYKEKDYKNLIIESRKLKKKIEQGMPYEADPYYMSTDDLKFI